MNKVSTDDYYMMAKQVSEDLPKNLRDFSIFITETEDLKKELLRILEPWMRTSAVYQSSYYHKEDIAINVLWYINAINSPQTSVSNNRKTYYEHRRHRRNYLGKSFEKDLIAGNGTLFKACEDYFSFFGGSKESKFPSKQAYLDDSIEHIRAWARDPSSDLIDYPLASYLKPAKRIQDYITDMSCHLFNIITDRYNSNPVSGMITSFPKDMINTAVFSGNSRDQKAKLTMDYSKDRISAVERHTVHQTDGSTVSTKIIAGAVEGDFPNEIASNPEVQNTIVASLKNEGKMFDIQSSLLDARDRSLFTIIYNSFTMDDISTGRKIMPLIDIIRSLNMVPQQKSYIYVLRRIDKMLRYRMDYTTYAENGKDVKELGSMVLFSRVGYQMPDKDGGIGATTFNMSDNTTPASYLDTLEQTDLKNVVVAIEPSPFLKEVMIKNVTVNILTKEYLRVVPDKMKSFLMLLQEERMRIYPESFVSLDYKFFSERLRFENMKPFAVKKQVKEALNYLEEAGIVVKSYEMKQYNVIIEFSAFTDTEKLLCRIDPSPKSER